MQETQKKSRKKLRKILRVIIIIFLITLALQLIYILYQREEESEADQIRAEISADYGENREIENGVYDSRLAVTCHNGTFVGTEENQVRSYKGIPYARPPVGDLRWKEPVPADADDGIYEAYYFGKSGIQTETPSERASYYAQGEDCLTLNIWTSDETQTSGKPVMVFMPGGAYGWGGTADPLYDGQNFVEAWDDIVLVTVNYRLGLMGFMDFSEVPGGEEYAKSGNLGLLDQVCALEWVQQNIEGFGGDPDQVTIFGESAGGGSVSLLPLMEGTDGLFERAIAESGSIALTYSREEVLPLTQRLLEETGCTTMEDLVALSEEDLMEVNELLNDFNNFPERDGIVLPEDLYEAYRNGQASDIEMLTGTNADENRYFIEDFGSYPAYVVAGSLIYKTMVASVDEKDQHYVDAFMDLQTDKTIWNRTEFLNEILFRIPAIKQAQYHADSGGRNYMYYWTKESAIPRYGACHAVELAYVFNNLDDTIYIGERADASLASEVQKMWVDFAKTGDPSTENYHWDPYDSVSRNTMVLGDEIHQVSDPLREQRELTEPLLSYRFNGYAGVYEDVFTYVGRAFLHFLGYFLLAEGVLIVVVILIRRSRKTNRGTDK